MGMAAVEEMAHAQGVDWVMVELTGLADPGPIAKGFWENEEMGDLVLDGVVCVVDCRNVLKVCLAFIWDMGNAALIMIMRSQRQQAAWLMAFSNWQIGHKGAERPMKRKGKPLS